MSQEKPVFLNRPDELRGDPADLLNQAVNAALDAGSPEEIERIQQAIAPEHFEIRERKQT